QRAFPQTAGRYRSRYRIHCRPTYAIAKPFIFNGGEYSKSALGLDAPPLNTRQKYFSGNDSSFHPNPLLSVGLNDNRFFHFKGGTQWKAIKSLPGAQFSR